MTNEKIEEYTLVAQFLGASPGDRRKKYKTYYFPFMIDKYLEIDPYGYESLAFLQERHYANIKEFKFDSDWSWTMKIVDKMNNLNYQIMKRYFKYREKEGSTVYNATMILRSTDFQLFVSTDIKKTYEATINFIRWFKENEKEEWDSL